MNATLFLDAALDALLDSLRMLPFLFVAFLILEALEHYSSNRLTHFFQHKKGGTGHRIPAWLHPSVWIFHSDLKPLLRRHCHSRNLDRCILIHFG